jgi:hypothetical protein
MRPQRRGSQGQPGPAKIDNELAKYYAGDVLTRKIDIAHQAIVGGDGVPVVDNAGVRDITFEAVTIAGSQAYVQTEGLSWATLRQTSAADAPSASPTDLVDWTFTLVKESDGSWRIIGEDWQFAPGSEP